jgi:L-lactate dehydrogenase
VSTLQQGLYGIRDVCLSVPTVVGCGGVRQQIELELTPKERLGLQNSARILREIIDQVEQRLGTGKATAAARVVSAPKGDRVVPRSAWQTVSK